MPTLEPTILNMYGLEVRFRYNDQLVQEELQSNAIISYYCREEVVLIDQEV